MGSYKGRQLPEEATRLVVRLKKHYDNERKAGKAVFTKNSAGRVAASMGLGIATVKRIMAKHAKGELIHKTPIRPGRPSEVCPNVQSAAREFIYGQNLLGQRVSVNQVQCYISEMYKVDIPKTSLWRSLSRWGFTFGEGRRRDSLKEQEHVIRARRSYLRTKRANRNHDGSLKRPEVYLDETYVNKNYSKRFTWYLDEDGPWVNKPSGVGPRLIILHAMTKDGWVDGAELVFEAKKRTGDYHGQMNWGNFSKWFKEQLLPNIPSNSLIVLDNARYHNVQKNDSVPSRSNSKDQLRSWLARNELPWGKDMLKSELLSLCLDNSSKPELLLDLIAQEHGHEILRTPPYHPELQPIETCWAVVKNDLADHCDFTMKGLRAALPDAFNKVTPQTCERILQNVVKQENKYWNGDEKLDEIFVIDDD